jgi:hypothetical protein
MPPSDKRRGPTRSTPKALLIVAGALLAARIALSLWYEIQPGAKPEVVNWTSPPAPGATTPSGKPVLYVFTDDTQSDSRRFSRDVLADERNARYLDGWFAAVKVDRSGKPPMPRAAEFRARFGVDRAPTFVVTSPDGGRFRKFSGYTNTQALAESLAQARQAMSDLPFIRSRSFRVGASTGGPIQLETDSTAQRPGRSPR